MKLRKKMFLQFLLLITVSLVLILIFVKQVLLSSYLRIDEEHSKQAMAGVMYAIDDELSNINTNMINFSAWDDTYTFVQGGGSPESYLRSNYPTMMYETNRLNLVLLLDEQQNIKYAKHYDLLEKKVRPLPAFFEERNNLWKLTRFTHPEDTKKGLLNIDGQPMMVVSQPIVTSESKGPIRGAMITGRLIGPEEVHKLSLRTQQDLILLPSVPADHSSEREVWVENLSPSTSRVYGVLHDWDGAPLLLIAAEQERVVYRQGLKTILYLGLYILIVAALSVFGAMKASDIIVINRINQLVENVRWISRNRSFEARMQPSGRDEIGELESEFNLMMSSLEASQTLIRNQALLDPLTQLPNRVAFYENLEQAIVRAKQNSRMLSVLFVDLDHFKHINDTWGHDAGDALLLTIIERMTDCLCSNALISRIGGDEFTILIADLDEPEIAHNLARRICETLSRPLCIGDRELKVTASIGYSFYPHDGDTAEALVKNADLAMYNGKMQGRNGIYAYSDDMRQAQQKQKNLELYLRSAVEQNELFLQYQPIVDISTGTAVGVEALVRWSHPVLGRVSPMDFIPLAEKTGLIHSIGKWVLKTGCTEIHALHQSGHRDLQLAINASAVQICEQGFIDDVMDILGETGFDPRRLKIEITESALMSDAEGVTDKLQQLRDAGIEISIDDFGTGYSSLHYLKKFPLDTLKVDKSFIDQIIAEDSDGTIAKAIIDLGRNLGLTVIAEGVETAEQVQFLQEQECHFVQGYYFSKPLDYGVLAGFIEKAILV